MAKRERAFKSQEIKNTDSSMKVSAKKWEESFGKSADDYINKNLMSDEDREKIDAERAEMDDSEYKTTGEKPKSRPFSP